MMLGRRRRHVIGAGLLPAGTPYVEQPDRKDSRLDSALQYAWGRVSPYMLSDSSVENSNVSSSLSKIRKSTSPVCRTAVCARPRMDYAADCCRQDSFRTTWLWRSRWRARQPAGMRA